MNQDEADSGRAREQDCDRESNEAARAEARDPTVTAPTASEEEASIAHEPLPEQIGKYRILSKLGEGGMGVVYLAEQSEPVRRRVALKVVKRGMDSTQVIARFEAERQALAVMDHPCVARVFDAGIAEDGRSYFVMEHVAGISITEHCDRQRMGIDERLALFMQVCDAVQHAHQKGIIHRDLKPTNVLVSFEQDKSAPKVIDFGVAKAVHQRLTENTLFTELGELIGTPEYMSPEQAEMTSQDIDTRSDIYSLGVLLYELLTGALPFDPKSLRRAGLGEIQRIIREEEPKKPSTKFSSLSVDGAGKGAAHGESTASRIAHQRRADARTLVRQIRGDLDWIVMKALEKDRTRRYKSASDLAAYIQKHLNGEAIDLGPPSAAYRISKFVRRHRTGVAAATVVAAALVSATGVSISFAVSEAEQRELAQQREKEANEAEADALLAEATSELDSLRLAALRLKIDPSLKGDVIDRANSLEQRLGAQLKIPRSELGGIRFTLGEIYIRTSQWKHAEEQLREVLSLRTEPREKADCQYLLAWALTEQFEFDEAKELYQEAERVRRKHAGEYPLKLAETLNDFGMLLRDMDNLEHAEAYLRDALMIRIGHDSEAPPYDRFVSHTTVGSVLIAIGTVADLEEAEDHLNDAIAILDDEYVHTLDRLSNLNKHGMLYLERGRFQDAYVLLTDVLAKRRSVLQHDNSYIASSCHNLAAAARGLGEYAEARKLHDEAIDVWAQISDAPAAWGRAGLAQTLLERRGEGDAQAAKGLCLEALEVLDKAQSPSRKRSADTRYLLGRILMTQEGGLREAAAELGRSRDWYGQYLPTHWRWSRAQAALSYCEIRLNEKDVEAAKQRLQDGYEDLLAKRGAKDRYTAEAYRWLAEFELLSEAAEGPG